MERPSHRDELKIKIFYTLIKNMKNDDNMGWYVHEWMAIIGLLKNWKKNF